MDDGDLTICSVSFDTARHLELNWDLVRYLNPAQPCTWVITENSPPHSRDLVDPQSGQFVVRRGEAFDSGHPRPASQHHGLGLNRAMESVRSRFVLILDPDFYIVRPNWMADVLEHMQVERLAFFGVPWHPKWHGKYRYFPCVHCLFIDLGQIPAATLDLRPGRGALGSNTSVKARIADVLGHLLPRPVFDVLSNVRGRTAIGRSQDTGHRVYQQYGTNSRIRAACVSPVYRPEDDYPVTSSLTVSRVLDRLLPDRLSYQPKETEYFTTAGFHERGYADVRAYGWEEFIWKEQPFGFHVRRQQFLTRDAQQEIARLTQVLAGWRSGGVRAGAAGGR
jgi:hypothetical protein